MPNLRLKIIKTLSFFSIFDYPLTAQELYRWLWKSPNISFGDFLKKLEQLDCSQIKNKDSFYFLEGNEDDIETRQSRVKLAKEKLDKANKAVRRLEWIPFIKAIFVCNTLALGAVEEDSDIDFFIVAESNRVWIVRFFTNLILKLSGLRVGKSKQKDRVCLSFFCSEDELDFSGISIESRYDIYLAYWIDQLLPLFDSDNIYQRLSQVNTWTDELITNKKQEKNVSPKIHPKKISVCTFIKSILERFWQSNYGNLIDNQARKLQERKLQFYLQEDYEDNHPNVIINKNIIKLHKNDSREEYHKLWQRNIDKLL